MVSREGRFDRCRLTEVVEELPGVCFRVAFEAESAAWFDADSHAAGPDGWVRGLTNVRAEFRIISNNHAGQMARAQGWLNAGTELRGFASLEHQSVGLIVAGRRPVRAEDVLVVSMSPAEMDRA